MSIRFAAGLSGDVVFSSWSVSDESEMDVSHSNWTFVRSIFGFFLGLIFPDGFVRCCAVGFLFCVFACCVNFDLLLKVLNSFCGLNAFRFNDCWMMSRTIFGGERFGLVEICVPSVVELYFVVFFPETRGFTRGRCLYAAKSFSATGLHFPYTLGSGINARSSCLITRGCLPCSLIHAVYGE